jgi:maleamate amidohydrolase
MARSNLAGAFDGRLSFGGRPALLLVDVVMAYLEPGSLLYGEAFVDALAANERLVAAARDGGVPVIFTNVVYQPGGAEVRRGRFRRRSSRAMTKRS